MNKFQNIYRTQSVRLQGWDYSQAGYYFITICTRNRECFLGDVKNNTMVLSPIGKIVKEHWCEMPQHFPNVVLDEYTIMPNHLHGIIIIKPTNIAETCHGMSLQWRTNKFSRPISGSLSIIINHFKSAVKRYCNKNGLNNFAWQPKFYEHIIRNEHSLNKIREYIINNHLQWDLDSENQNRKWNTKTFPSKSNNNVETCHRKPNNNVETCQGMSLQQKTKKQKKNINKRLTTLSINYMI